MARSRPYGISKKKRFFLSNYSSGGGEAEAQAWSNAREFTVGESETLQYVVVDKHAGMKADYSDLRFCVNPSGTTSQKKFLPYWIESSDENSAGVWVGFKQAPAVASTFYAIWGNASAESYANPYQTAFTSGYLYNDFSRGAKYDVSNVLASWDEIFEGPGDASEEYNWPSITQLPTFQNGWGTPSDDDWNHIFVAFKYDPDQKNHAGGPLTKPGFKHTHDFGETWSEVSFIYDPDEDYRATSSSSVAIPTSGATEVTFTVEADRAFQPGDIARAYADETHWIWFTVTSYSGTTLVGTRLSHNGTGTFDSWIISQRFGITNPTITSVLLPSGTVRLVAAFSRVDFYNTEGSGASVHRIFSCYTDLNSSYQPSGTWSEPIMISNDSWSNHGGKSTTSHDGIVWIPWHENAITTADYSSSVGYTRDYGLTWAVIRTVAEGTVLLDETDLRQMRDPDTGEWLNLLRCTARNEDATTSEHQYAFDITWDDETAQSENIRESEWYDNNKAKWSSVRCPDGKTVYYVGGDSMEKMIYTRDEGQTWHQIPFQTLATAAVSARRVYTELAVHPDGRMIKVWASNILSDGSDLYINYFDWTLNQLYSASSSTMTNGAGVRNRPTDLNPGIRIGEWLTGYRTSSTSSISVPSAGQQRTLTVATGLNWATSDTGTCVYTNNVGVRFTFTVVSYNSGTGELVVECIAATGSGTQSTWQLNIGTADNTGNLLANQNYLSIPKGRFNGQVNPVRVRLTVKSYGSTALFGGYWGVKKFETRALAVVTISDEGNEGDVITIKWKKSGDYANGLFGGLGTVATYTVQSGDAIADVVNGLVASANLIGICHVSTSDATTLTLLSQLGSSTFINGIALTIETTGDVAGSSGNFASGTAMETPTALQNIIVFDNGNNVVRIEQANDNHSQAFTVTDADPVDYTIEWDDASVVASDGTTTRTKTGADGSGVPNWQGQLEFVLTTSVGSPAGLIEVYHMETEPLADTEATAGDDSTGEFTINSLGDGLE